MLLRVQPVQHSREWDRFADVFEPADPGDSTLESHAEPSVRNTADLAQVQLPLESFFGQAVLVDPLEQQIIRGHTL